MGRASHLKWTVSGVAISAETVPSAACSADFGGFFILGGPEDPVGLDQWTAVVLVEWTDAGAFVVAPGGCLNDPLGNGEVQMVRADGLGLIDAEVDVFHFTRSELRELGEMLLTRAAAESADITFGFVSEEGLEFSLPTSDSLVALLDKVCPDRLATGVEEEAVDAGVDADASGDALGEEVASPVVGKRRGKNGASAKGAAKAATTSTRSKVTPIGTTQDLRGVRTIAGLATALQDSVVEPLAMLGTRVLALESRQAGSGAAGGGAGPQTAGGLFSSRPHAAASGAVAALGQARASAGVARLESPVGALGLGRIGGAVRGAPGFAYPARQETEHGLAAPPGITPGSTEVSLAQAVASLGVAVQGLQQGDRRGGAAGGAAQSVQEFTGLLEGSADSKHLGTAQLERIQATTLERPDLVIAAGQQLITREMGVLPGESWSHRKFAKEEIYPACPTHKTLLRTVAIVTEALDRGRVYGAAAEHAFLLQSMKVLKDAAESEKKDLGYAWPLLGIPDPATTVRPFWTPSERVALASYHRDESTLAAARTKLASGQSSGDKDTTPDGGGDAVKKQIDSAVNAALKKEREKNAAYRRPGVGGAVAAGAAVATI
jgi:hypothetical protein